MSQQVANWIVTPAGEHTNRRSSHFHNRCSAVNGCNVGHAVLSIASGHYYAELGQFEDAWRCFGEATTPVETIKERWSEAKINRAVGELALVAAKPDATKAEPITSSPSQSRANNKPNPGNSAPQ
jgi:hypothetical protein